MPFCSTKTFTAAALSLLAIGAAPAQASWFKSLQVQLFNDDNLSRSEQDTDIESDSGLGALLRGGYAWELDNGKRVTLTGSLGGDVHDEFGGMDRIGAALDFGFRNRMGLGAQAPTLSLSAGILRDDYDEDVRDALG